MSEKTPKHRDLPQQVLGILDETTSGQDRRGLENQVLDKLTHEEIIVGGVCREQLSREILNRLYKLRKNIDRANN